MKDINSLKIYFNNIGKTIEIDGFYFNININQNDDDDSFSINFKVRQKDNKEEHLIKIRVGIGKHIENKDATHNPGTPHFEIDYYKVKKRSFSATIYFEFNKVSDEELMNYAKGTVVIIAKILDHFFEKHNIDLIKLSELVEKELVFSELSSSEEMLIDALYECYKKSNLVVRRKGQTPLIIKTEHNLKKFLGVEDFLPIYVPLFNKIRKK